MGTRLTFKQKLYKTIADAAALEHEMAACLFLEITHKFQIKPGVHLRKVVTIAVCNSGVRVPAEVIKPYVDDHLHTLFRLGDPTYQKIKLTHNDPRFWGLFRENRDENRIALKASCRHRASV